MLLSVEDLDHDHHDHNNDEHLDPDDQPVMAGGVVPLSVDDCHARLLSLNHHCHRLFHNSHAHDHRLRLRLLIMIIMIMI